MMRGVVFDFDGVIARTMHLHAQAYKATLAPLGVRLTDEEVYQLEGGRSESLIRRFMENAGKTADSATVERLSREKQAAFRSLGTPPLYEGAEAMIRRVRAKAQKTAIVTGTRKENLERMIPSLLPLFDAVLAQDAYTKDKPDPQPYQRAAQALGLPPQDCVAVENAPYGVQSARAAGYGRIVALTTTVSADQLSACGAHDVVADQAAAAAAVLRALGA